MISNNDIIYKFNRKASFTFQMVFTSRILLLFNDNHISYIDIQNTYKCSFFKRKSFRKGKQHVYYAENEKKTRKCEFHLFVTKYKKMLTSKSK